MEEQENRSRLLYDGITEPPSQPPCYCKVRKIKPTDLSYYETGFVFKANVILIKISPNPFHILVMLSPSYKWHQHDPKIIPKSCSLTNPCLLLILFPNHLLQSFSFLHHLGYLHINHVHSCSPSLDHWNATKLLFLPPICHLLRHTFIYFQAFQTHQHEFVALSLPHKSLHNKGSNNW